MREILIYTTAFGSNGYYTVHELHTLFRGWTPSRQPRRPLAGVSLGLDLVPGLELVDFGAHGVHHRGVAPVPY